MDEKKTKLIPVEVPWRVSFLDSQFQMIVAHKQEVHISFQAEWLPETVSDDEEISWSLVNIQVRFETQYEGAWIWCEPDALHDWTRYDWTAVYPSDMPERFDENSKPNPAFSSAFRKWERTWVQRQVCGLPMIYKVQDSSLILEHELEYWGEHYIIHLAKMNVNIGALKGYWKRMEDTEWISLDKEPPHHNLPKSVLLEAEDHFNRAMAHKRNLDANAMLEDLNQALALVPTNLDYLWERANLLYERDEHKDAIDDYTRIIELSTNLGALRDAYIKRAICYTHLGYFKAAIADLDWLIDRYSKRENHYAWRGDHKRTLGDLSGAISDYTKAIQFSSEKNFELYMTRGTVYAQLERFEEALEDLTQALSFANLHSTILEIVYHWRGSVYYRMRDYESALADFNAIMQLKELPLLSDAEQFVSQFSLAM